MINLMQKQSIRHQQGAVLMVSLMVLLMLTVLTLSSAQTILLQEKMTASARDSRLAFQVAESAAADAMKHLEGLDSSVVWSTSSQGTKGYYQADPDKIDSPVYPGAGDNSPVSDYFTTGKSGIPDAFATTDSIEAETAIDCGSTACTDKKGRYFIVNMGPKTFDLSASGNVTSNIGTYKANSNNVVEACMYRLFSWGEGNNPASDVVIVVEAAYQCI